MANRSAPGPGPDASREEPAANAGGATRADKLGRTRTDAGLSTDPDGAADRSAPDRNLERTAEAIPADAALIDFDARYRVIRELARGGMGRILLAEDRALGRQVAVKEMLAAGHKEALVRFELEARLSARLQHPGIVSVHDFARGRGGESYLVMRLVQGKTLTSVLQGASTIEKRLALLPAFIAACDAVAYAHQQGVVHRDLKPDNILLGDFGDTVVIDWGIAKDLRQGASAKADGLVTLPAGNPSPTDQSVIHTSGQTGGGLTLVGRAIGTPGFMSPEQGRGEPADERADVYALGALLYTLLAGRAPFQGDTRLILKSVEEGRFEPLSGLGLRLPAELITIVDRAMALKKDERYPTAGALIEDLKSFQAGRLVRTHSYSLGQLVRRWMRRNALALSLSAAFLVLLSIGGVLAVRRVLLERDRASREAQTAEKVSGFVTGMFKVSDPSESRGNSITAREILDRASGEIQGQLSEEPEVRSRLLGTMGNVYRSLGLYKKSRPLLESSLEGYRAAHAPEKEIAQAMEALCALGSLDGELKDMHAVELECRETVAIDERVLGPEARNTFNTKLNLAAVLGLEGLTKDEEALLQTSLESSKRASGETSANSLHLANALANALLRSLKFAEAHKVQSEALAIERRTLGNDDPLVQEGLRNLGMIALRTHHPAEAEMIDREVLASAIRIYGPDHLTTVDAKEELAMVIDGEGHQQEALPLLREVVAASIKDLGADHHDTLQYENNLANTLAELSQLDEAEQLYKHIAERAPHQADSDNMMMVVLANLSQLAGRKGDAIAAQAQLAEAVKRGFPRDQLGDVLDDPAYEKIRGTKEFKEMQAMAAPGPK